MSERHIVIIGGGFSGTALAIHLARGGAAGLRVTLVEPRAEPGRGVAYSTDDPAHRINVPADRMQLAGAEVGEFDRWYRASEAYQLDPAARWPDGKAYPQRGRFGDYIGQQFIRAQQQSAALLTHLCDRAVALRDGVVTTAGGQRLVADEVVLAVSHPPPALPRALRQLAGHVGLIADPWQPGALASIGSGERVAIIGSGLTMSDVVATLHRHGHRGAVTAFSRRGLLPRANLSGEYAAWTPDDALPQAGSARGWLRRVRRDVAAAAAAGQPWQLVLDAVRAHGQQIWQQLPLREQRRFLRHLRPWWDVHRYRIAPQVSAVIEDLQQRQQLRVRAARLRAVTRAGDGLVLTLAGRDGVTEYLSVDRLIVTTGPAHDALLQSSELLRQLAADGVIRADALALGIDVSPRSATLNRQGEENPHLYVAGPAARGRFGELMGLPQVAEHAESLARQLLSAEARTILPPADMPEIVCRSALAAVDASATGAASTPEPSPGLPSPERCRR